MMSKPFLSGAALGPLAAALLATGGCRHAKPPSPTVVPASARALGGSPTTLSAHRPRRAHADLAPLGAASVHGTLALVETEDGVHIVGALYNLPPNGAHGFHVHEHGDCSATDGSSAGGHFNPDDVGHGDHAAPDAHAGDLGNLHSDANGVAKVDILKPNVSLDAADKSFIGRAFIVHERPDDLVSQPTGGSGDRIGCGVIVADG